MNIWILVGLIGLIALYFAVGVGAAKLLYKYNTYLERKVVWNYEDCLWYLRSPILKSKNRYVVSFISGLAYSTWIVSYSVLAMILTVRYLKIKHCGLYDERRWDEASELLMRLGEKSI